MYDLNKSEDTSNIRKRIENNMPINFSPSEKACSTSLCLLQLKKSHIMIHQLFPKARNPRMHFGHMSLDEVNLDVSFISMSDGQINNNQKNILITGSSFENYLLNHASKCLLFDCTDESINGSHQSWVSRSGKSDYMPHMSSSQSSLTYSNSGLQIPVPNIPSMNNTFSFSRMSQSSNVEDEEHDYNLETI